MKQTKILIQLPVTLKAQLDALRLKGFTISGYIRSSGGSGFTERTVRYGTSREKRSGLAGKERFDG